MSDSTMESVGQDYASLRIVSPAYAGREGELTAVLQYVYQSVLLGQGGEEEDAKEVHKIAVQEMRHLQILGTLICRLGASPVFTACPPYPVGYYSASCVSYVRQPAAMFEADCRAERAAIDGYTRMLAKLKNPAVSEIIEGIRAQECEHLRIFEALAARYR